MSVTYYISVNSLKTFIFNLDWCGVSFTQCNSLFYFFYFNTKSSNLLRLILLSENVLSILFIQSLVINVYFIMIFINVIHVLQTLHFVQVGKTKMHILFSLHTKIILKPGTICLSNFLCLNWSILIQIYYYAEMCIYLWRPI